MKNILEIKKTSCVFARKFLFSFEDEIIYDFMIKILN